MSIKPSFIGIVAAALAAASLTASAKAPPDERPEIYLDTVTATGTSLTVVSVDGERASSIFKKKRRLSAGRHELALATGFLESRERGDRATYLGWFRFTFDAKEGMSYVFAIDPPTGGIWRDSRACLYEEARNDPQADITSFGALRHPGPNATLLECVPIDVQPL